MGDAAYKVLDGVATFRLTGAHELEAGVLLVRDAIQQTKKSGVGKLLVDISGIQTRLPSMAERHWAMTELAAAGRSAIRLAIVARPEFLDPERFGTAVARSRGFLLKPFTSEESAMNWLIDRHDRDAGNPRKPS